MEAKTVKVMSYALLFSMCVMRISMALGNIGLVIAVIAFLYWCYLHKGQLLSMVQEKLGKDFLRLYLLLLICFLPSALFPEPYSPYWYSLKQFPEMLIYRALPFFMLVLAVEKESLLKRLLFVFLGVEALDSLLSIWQVYGSPQLQPVAMPQYGYRGIGFGGQVLNLSALLASLIPIATIIALDKSFAKNLRLMAGISLACMLLGAIFGLKSRALWLILFLFLPFIVYPYAQNSKKVLCLFAVLVFATGTFFATNVRFQNRLKSSFNITTDASNTDRLWLWKSSLNMFKEHPLTGVGLGNYRFAYKKKYQLPEIKQKHLSHAHNNWMHIAADAGLPGVLGYSIFTLGILWSSFKNWLKNSSPYDLMLFYAWAGFSAYGLVDLTADASISVKLLCFLSGIVVCMRQCRKEEK